jgi:hypothetical protein
METHITYVLYTALFFLKYSPEGLFGGGGVLLVHNEIHYVPIGDGWEEVLVRNVLHYVPVLHHVPITQSCDYVL